MGQGGDENVSGGYVHEGASLVARWQILYGHKQGSSALPTTHDYVDLGTDADGGRERFLAFARLAATVDASVWLTEAQAWLQQTHPPAVAQWSGLTAPQREKAQRWLRGWLLTVV